MSTRTIPAGAAQRLDRAFREGPRLPPVAHLLLIRLANRAGTDGTTTIPAAPYSSLGIDEAAMRRALHELEAWRLVHVEYENGVVQLFPGWEPGR